MNASALQKIVADVVGAAEADPDRAPEILTDAASTLRSFAVRRENRNMAALLAANANEFDAAAQHYRAFAAEDFDPDSLVKQSGGSFPAGSATGAATTGNSAPGAPTLDDFGEQEQEKAQAAQETIGQDDLALKARQNQIHEEKKRRNRVSIAPRSFNESTPLGRNATIKFAPTQTDTLNNIVQSATVAMWNGDKEETQALSVDIGVSKFPAPGSGVSCRPQAIITYGTDGFQQSVTVDVGLGQRVNVPGNVCMVLVEMLPPAPGLPSGVMTVGATISPFASPSQSQVTLTAYVDALAAPAAGVNSNAVVVRPFRAQYILPPQNTDPNGSTTLSFYDYSAIVPATNPVLTPYNTGLLYRLTFANGSVVSPIPITNDVVVIAVTNVGTIAATYRLPFMLAL